mmetsp:Transcript_16591/g.49561  ORF Transcript_16591/g.49561 Transcript_16591/m.49561 type:complete len:98 (-) Transcript_16591:672-965(-)
MRMREARGDCGHSAIHCSFDCNENASGGVDCSQRAAWCGYNGICGRSSAMRVRLSALVAQYLHGDARPRNFNACLLLAQGDCHVGFALARSVGVHAL